MRTRVQPVSRAILLVEEHPLRNRVYRAYMRGLGYPVIVSESVTSLRVPEHCALAVVSIPEAPLEHSKYRAFVRALPEQVACIILTAGTLPPLFEGCVQVVGHINRTLTHPRELIEKIHAVFSE